MCAVVIDIDMCITRSISIRIRVNSYTRWHYVYVHSWYYWWCCYCYWRCCRYRWSYCNLHNASSIMEVCVAGCGFLAHAAAARAIASAFAKVEIQRRQAAEARLPSSSARRVVCPGGSKLIRYVFVRGRGYSRRWSCAASSISVAGLGCVPGWISTGSRRWGGPWLAPR